MNIRIGLFIAGIDYIYIYSINRIPIYWELLVKFSCNLHETLCNIRLLSVLLTILVSGCYNTKAKIVCKVYNSMLFVQVFILDTNPVLTSQTFFPKCKPHLTY